MTTSLFHRAELADQACDEWIASLADNTRVEFMNWLFNNVTSTESQNNLYLSWCNSYGPTGSKYPKLFTEIQQVQHHYWAFIMNLDPHSTHTRFLQFTSGLMGYRALFHQFSHDLLRLGNRQFWSYNFSNPQTSYRNYFAQGDHLLVPTTPASIDNLHERCDNITGLQSGLDTFIRQISFKIGDLQYHFDQIREAQARLDPIVKLIAALLQPNGSSSANDPPSDAISTDLKSFMSHIEAQIQGHFSKDLISKQLHALSMERTLCLATCPTDRGISKCLGIKLADTDDIELICPETQTSWSNFHDLWLVFPFSLTDSYFRVMSLSKQEPKDPVFWYPEDMHPHVNGSGNLCLGDAHSVGTKLWVQKDLLPLVDLCSNALRCYNEDNPYWSIGGDNYEDDDDDSIVCCGCDRRIDRDYALYTPDHYSDAGDVYCERCFDDTFCHDPVTDNYYYSSDFTVHITHGPLNGEYTTEENYQEYLENHPLPVTPEETSDDEVAESETQGNAGTHGSDVDSSETAGAAFDPNP
jgi:hypothetical protein